MAIERVWTEQFADDEPFQNELRPRRLQECIGQQVVREQLKIALEAAQRRGEPLEHMLLDGPPGLGKTTLAHVIATEMGGTIRVTSGPAIARQGDLMSLLTQLEAGDVVFVDEIHRLPRVVEEFLYPAIEDFRVDYTMERGVGGRTVNFPLKRFTLIGATTRAGMLSAALRSRFGMTFHFQWYSADELTAIVARSAGILGAPADADALALLATRARGTPRIVNNLLKRVRDYADVRGDGRITAAMVSAALAIHQIDELGLGVLDRGYMETLARHYDGGPAGIEAISASMGHERDTLEDMVEPYLLQIGFVVRTPRGRMLRPRAYQHLGLAAPSRADQAGLFD